MKLLSRFVLRYSGWVLLVAALSAVPCVYWTARLYGNLKPDLEELLPKDSRSVQDLTEIRNRLQATDYLAVLMFSENAKGAKRFSIDLAHRLEKAIPETISGVEYRIDRELKFFGNRKLLFLELQDLLRVRDYISQKIEYEKGLYNPLNIFSGEELKEPTLDLKGIVHKYESQASGFSHFPEGFYATPDGKKRVVLVNLPSAKGGLEGMKALKEETERAVQELKPESYAADLKILYTGGVQITLEELDALLVDVEKSAEIVFILVTLLLILFFRSILATLALFMVLFVARFWTFAFGWFTVGYLNANSAFMGSIVLGSGITFGVILLSRYLEERRNGRVPLRAARISMIRTARATLTASLAASAAYGSLFLTKFEGFRQYGVLGFAGMVFCWITSVLVFPALLVQMEKWKPLVRGRQVRRSWIFDPICYLLGKFPLVILWMSGALTIYSIYHIAKLNPEKVIETNLSNLRNQKTMKEGSGYLTRYLDEIFHHYLSPLAILTKNEEEAREVQGVLKKKMEKGPDSALLSSVQTIDRFVPADQYAKIEVLKEIRRELRPSILVHLSDADRAKVKDLWSPESFHPFSKNDLPQMIRSKFTEKDGSLGKMVLIEPAMDSGSWNATQIGRFVQLLRESGDEVASRRETGQRFPVAGPLPVVADLLDAVAEDGPKASCVAFVAVVALIILLFRKPSVILLVLFALILGNVWMFGILLAWGLKINFLNFIALPITFGIGVDYGVNIFHRYQDDDTKDILKVVRETGGAVGLCSLTTITGYSSLLIAQNQAFVSFGKLAVLGEVTSLVAAVITLPAFLLVMQKLRRKPLTGVLEQPIPLTDELDPSIPLP